MTPPRFLVVRLGAMGDVISALPAVATLKHSFPRSKITWVIDTRWKPLLERNPHVDSVVEFDRRTFSGLRQTWADLRRERFDVALDLQGLIKSALVSAAGRPEQIIGFDADHARESVATWFYSTKVAVQSAHVVDQNLELVAIAGASNALRAFPLPQGAPEGTLPDGDFVLASPLAGWGGKQWPMEYYASLAEKLRIECGLPLVLNAPHAVRVPRGETHVSGLSGLIYATRRATAVVGIDSGPMHLAAALGKPGVAIFGQTDPARNGPYQSQLHVLRSPNAKTSYRRIPLSDPSMRDVTPEQVFTALEPILAAGHKRTESG